MQLNQRAGLTCNAVACTKVGEITVNATSHHRCSTEMACGRAWAANNMLLLPIYNTTSSSWPRHGVVSYSRHWHWHCQTPKTLLLLPSLPIKAAHMHMSTQSCTIPPSIDKKALARTNNCPSCISNQGGHSKGVSIPWCKDLLKAPQWRRFPPNCQAPSSGGKGKWGKHQLHALKKPWHVYAQPTPQLPLKPHSQPQPPSSRAT